MSNSESTQYTVEWRYDRTGIYANETGLLKTWPAGGPELLWYYDGLGEGHSSVGITSDKAYVTGMLDGKGYLFVFDLHGKLLNKVLYGDEWTENYVGARATPIINNGKIYLMSGAGDLVCLNEQSLDVIWKKNIFVDFESENIRWGFNESPLIIGDKLIITPGGKKNNVVALDKNTGKLIWSSPGKGDLSAYCSPLYIGDQETPLIVTITAENIIGLEASTGKLLWSFESKNRNNIHSNTPVYADNRILCTSVDKGCTMLRLSEGGRSAEIVWELPEWDNMMGALVKVGDYIYGSGSGYKERVWYCVDWATGEIKYKETGLGMGVTIYADGMFYCYTDKGEMALVKATPEKFEIVSQFMIEKGTEQHWAHPVIYQGVLYVRHGDSFMAYKIK
jgi:outer membrane protein assembly factor BamB